MDRTTAYARSVVDGSIFAGEEQKRSCRRHLNDLERQNTDEFPYYFDSDLAERMIKFAELLNIAEGSKRKPLKCQGFQAFIFGSWHGWRNKYGHRRFRTSYVQVGRQNGKSIGNAVPCLFYGNFDEYQYPQIYTTATKELQARIVLKECIKFIDADADLAGTEYEKGLFTVKEYKALIECNQTNGEIRALGRDTKSIDGFRPYFASVDEYHLHKDDQMYKLLSDGTVEMDESLVSVITTAGFDLNSPCFELYEYCKQITTGVVEDETQFVFICELDKDDDIWEERNWQKANPLWSEKRLRNLRASAIKAKAMGGKEMRNFMTKALNIWVQFSDNQYLNYEAWKNCESDKTLEDFKGSECFIGLDLSSGGDLTSLAVVIPFLQEENKKYFIHSHSFIPSRRVAEHIKSDLAPYDIWIMSKLLTVTETLGGVKTDYKYITAYIQQLIQEYELEVIAICYDPHNSSGFLGDLESLGIDCIEITQSARSLNDATVDLQLEVLAGNVEYNKDNKLLTWSAINAKTVSNSFGEIKIDKDSTKRMRRIDPIDSVIDAWKLAMGHSADEASVENYLELMGW